MNYITRVLLAVLIFNSPGYAEESPVAAPETEATTVAETPQAEAAQPENEACAKTLEAAQAALTQCQTTSQKLQDDWQQRLTRCEAELQQTRQTVTTEVDKQAAAEQNLSACQSALAEAEQNDAKQWLPPSQGGTATAATAQQQASAAKDAYLARLKVVGTVKNAIMTDAELLKARRNLASAQALLLQVTEGLGLYGIRRNDTLSIVAKEVYGNGSRWRDIFIANQHILPNENQLETGLTLVLPR